MERRRPTVVASHANPGPRLELTLNAPADGTYNITGYFTRAKDYAKMQASIAGKTTGPEIDLYAPEVTPSGPLSLGQATLTQGQQQTDFHHHRQKRAFHKLSCWIGCACPETLKTGEEMNKIYK